MDLDAAVRGLKAERESLRNEGFSSPAYISEHMYRLSQYTASVEEGLADLEEELEITESEYFKSMIGLGKSVNATTVSMKHEFSEKRSRISKLVRLVSSSWRLVSASQSRIKNLMEEGKNQI